MEDDEDDQATESRASHQSFDRGQNSDRDVQSTQQQIGDKIGIDYRAPSFGNDPLRLKQSPNYLGVSSPNFFADHFNRKFLSDDRIDILTAASEKISGRNTFSVGASATGQLGVFYPIIGFGPSVGVGGNVGLTPEKDVFFQIQGSLGGGIGSFAGVGTNWQYTQAEVQEGWSDGWQLELNVGLGESRSFQLQYSDGKWTVASDVFPKQLNKLENGVGFGASVSFSRTIAYTAKIPTAQYWNEASRSWNDFSTSVGRVLGETEVQVYQWSRMMEP